MHTTTYRHHFVVRSLLLIGGYALFLPLKLTAALSRTSSTRTKAKAVVITGGNILLVKNTLAPTEWTLPGGGLEPGESPQQAIIRELREELGLKLRRGELRHAKSLDRRTTKLKCDYEIYAAVLPESSQITLSLEILEARCFDRENLPKHTMFMHYLPSD